MMSGSAWVKNAEKRIREEHCRGDALGRQRAAYRLRRLDGHKLVVSLLPTDVAEGPVVPGVLGDVADLVDRVVMEEHLRNTQRKGFKQRRTRVKGGAKHLPSVPLVPSRPNVLVRSLVALICFDLL